MNIELLRGILLIVTFIIFVFLMVKQTLPTIIALPLMAIAFAVIAGVPFMSSDPEIVTIGKTILTDGVFRLSSAIAGVIFGSFFGQVINKVGITKNIIRKAAEMAGDRPITISLAFLAVGSIIFAAANGLGMVILVGTIILPIMITVGVSPFVSGTVLLLANLIGSTMNVSGWAMYQDLLGLDIDTIGKYSFVIIVPLIIFGIFYIIYSINKDGQRRKAWAMPEGKKVDNQKIGFLAYLSPLVPVVLVFLFKMEIVPAVLIGAVYALIVTWERNPIHIVSSSLVEGVQDVGGAIILMIGIGMLLNSVTAPQVSALITPIIDKVLPTTSITIILFFTILSPLALYRGPLNTMGLGSGIAALLATSGMNPVTVMLAFRVLGDVQGICDPTNSHNVWIADFVKVDAIEFVKKLIFYMIICVFISLCIGVTISMR